MVDAERIGARLDRLEWLVERLEEVHAGGEEQAYMADVRVRADLREFARVVQGLADGRSEGR